MLKPIVIYASNSGNTKQIAESIVEEMKCSMINLKETSLNNIDLKDYNLILIGSGIYKGLLHNKVLEFLKTVELPDTKTFAFFVTWFGRSTSDQGAINTCREILERKNQKVIKSHFQCYGKGFRFVRKGHPNDKDVVNAKKWADDLMTTFNKRSEE